MPTRTNPVETDVISVGRVRVGDLTHCQEPRVHRCHVRAIRAAGPGVRCCLTPNADANLMFGIVPRVPW